MSKFTFTETRRLIVDEDEYNAFVEAHCSSEKIAKCDDHEVYHKSFTELVDVLSKHAKEGGIFDGDFYMSSDWYGNFSFGVILNTRELFSDESVKSLIEWLGRNSNPAVVFWSGCGLEVDCRLIAAFSAMGGRICWEGKSARYCASRIEKNELGITWGE